MRRGYGKTRVVVFNAPSAAMWGRPVHSRRRIHMALCGLVVVTISAFIMAVYVFNKVSHRESFLSTWNINYHPHFRPQAFQSNDGLEVTWYSELNSEASLLRVLEGPYTGPMVLGGDVTVQLSGSPRPFPTLVMAPSAGKDSDITLEHWLDLIISNGMASGVKLKFKGSEGIGVALDLLASKATDLNHLPVFISADVVPGPGGTGDTVSTSWLVKMLNSTYPHIHLVLGWSSPCCVGQAESGGRYGRGSMESMLKAIRHIHHQPILISAPATQVTSSWQHFRWLLGHSERVALLLTSPQDDPHWTNGTVYDMLTVRNDWNRKQVFYDMPEVRLDQLRRLAITAGTPLHAFDIIDLDAAHVTWAHGANDVTSIKRAISDDVMMIEGDVSLDGQGTPKQTDVPIMTHRSPVATSNVTLERWLDIVLNTNKGIKLDFKSTEAIYPALKILQQKRSRLNRPVWLNADVVRGPNAIHDPINASVFLRTISALLPEVTLSLGWTSGWAYGQDNEAYSWDMVEKMEKTARRLRQPVTFAVRAVLAKRSWEKFDWLLRQSRRYSLTLWSSVMSADRVTKSDLEFMRHQFERSRIYFDVPDDVMPDLH